LLRTRRVTNHLAMMLMATALAVVAGPARSVDVLEAAQSTVEHHGTGIAATHLGQRRRRGLKQKRGESLSVDSPRLRLGRLAPPLVSARARSACLVAQPTSTGIVRTSGCPGATQMYSR